MYSDISHHHEQKYQENLALVTSSSELMAKFGMAVVEQ
jgi:hypothetical protein